MKIRKFPRPNYELDADVTLENRPIRTKEKGIRASDWPEGEDEFGDIVEDAERAKSNANKFPANQRHRKRAQTKEKVPENRRKHREVPESDKKAPEISKSAGKC